MPKMPPATAGTNWRRPTQSLMAWLVGGTPRSSWSAGRTISGSIKSTYESNAKPMAAMMAITHWMGVKRVEEASDCTVGMAIGVPHKDCPPGKYLARVARLGRDVDVRSETVTIRNAETMVMGTTGRTPNTVVPDAARLTTSMPPHER